MIIRASEGKVPTSFYQRSIETCTGDSATSPTSKSAIPDSKRTRGSRTNPLDIASKSLCYELPQSAFSGCSHSELSPSCCSRLSRPDSQAKCASTPFSPRVTRTSCYSVPNCITDRHWQSVQHLRCALSFSFSHRKCWCITESSDRCCLPRHRNKRITHALQPRLTYSYGWIGVNIPTAARFLTASLSS